MSNITEIMPSPVMSGILAVCVGDARGIYISIPVRLLLGDNLSQSG